MFVTNILQNISAPYLRKAQNIAKGLHMRDKEQEVCSIVLAR